MISSFIHRQYSRIEQGSWQEVVELIQRSTLFILGLLPALLFLISMRLIKPILLVRINRLISPRIGHLTANTEQYLCERIAGINVPKQRYVDLHFHGGCRISNKQLALMWKRKLRIWPKWLLEPVYILNKWIPGGSIHDVDGDYMFGRDVFDLLERTPIQLKFTPEEELRGQKGLKDIGIPSGAEFICLIVRDSAYLDKVLPVPGKWKGHNYRDSDINNYILAAEELAERGYYVVRMGEVVNAPMKSANPKIIDYATNGMRSDFMDIYLGANCLFCISTATGFDGVPAIFRRPTCYVSQVPIGFLETYRINAICLCKRHWLESEQRELTLNEIFSFGVGLNLGSSTYDAKGISLKENTPEEITDAVIEMLERLKGAWKPDDSDEDLQRQFWNIFPTDATFRNKPLHGTIRAKYSAKFLRSNPSWLQ